MSVGDGMDWWTNMEQKELLNWAHQVTSIKMCQTGDYISGVQVTYGRYEENAWGNFDFSSPVDLVMMDIHGNLNDRSNSECATVDFAMGDYVTKTNLLYSSTQGNVRVARLGIESSTGERTALGT